jgi:amidase
MKLAEYASYDGLGLADLVKRKQVSPRELALMARDAIEAVNGDLNAVVEIYDDRIERLDEASLGKGPFRGVPFLIKDVFGHLKGRKVEFGSRLCEGMIGEVDTNFARLCMAAGLNILGRSNTPEYSLSSSTENKLYGNTSNPWRKGYSAGGSTGGGAAAVTAGMVPVAHGSDIGGSIRIPASWCGGVGLKPSRGRVSAGPTIDEGGWGMATNFVQTKTMRDTAAMLDCVGVPQPGDPFVIPRPSRSYLAHLKSELKPLRIAWSAKPLMKAPVDPEVAKAVEVTARFLAGQGHQVEEAAPAFDVEEVNQHFVNLWFFAFDKRLEAYGRKVDRRPSPQTLEAVTYKLYELAKTIGPQQLMDAVAYMNGVRRRIGAFFSTYDIWITPATALVAEPHGRYDMDRDAPAERHIIDVERPCQYPLPFNVTGNPAISLPLAMHSSGLPIGVQLGARAAEEHLLIQLGGVLEEAMPWGKRVPTIHVSKAR